MDVSCLACMVIVSVSRVVSFSRIKTRKKNNKKRNKANGVVRDVSCIVYMEMGIVNDGVS